MGAALNVHEGPQSISTRYWITTPLQVSDAQRTGQETTGFCTIAPNILLYAAYTRALQQAVSGRGRLQPDDMICRYWLREFRAGESLSRCRPSSTYL